MSSITSWTRLEPRARSENLAPGLEARVHDPLWLLARQWQLGELTGEDAASAVAVRVVAEAAPVTAYRLGNGPVRELAGGVPLETLVEREPGPDPVRDVAFAARAGLHFLRLLAARPELPSYREALITRYRLRPMDIPEDDAAARRAAAVLSRRAPNGALLAAALREAVDTGTLPLDLAGSEEHTPAVWEAIHAWIGWLGDVYSRAGEGEEAWDPRRMEYAVALAAPGSSEAPAATVLAAPGYDGGRLDWYDFDAVPANGMTAGGEPETVDVRVLPAAASYPGMPVDRWWEFEDARIDFGRVEAAPGDLSRLLVAEYAMIYSNDWFLVPLDLAAGSVCRIRAVLVFDTFGGCTLVEESGTELDHPEGWSLFRTSTPAGSPSDLLFLAPGLPSPLEGQPLEEVRFFRDEMANLAWAVEARVENRAGRPLDRHQLWAERRGTEPPPPPLPPGGPLVYRLETEVPEHWFALNPEADPEHPGAMRLRLLTRQYRREDGRLLEIAPRGRLLEQGSALRLYEEEVPREGLRVRRAWQHARGADGSTHVWIGRRKAPGRGEGSSGLQYDVIEPAREE